MKRVEAVAEPAAERSPASWAQALFEGIDDAVFVHDLEGRILEVNPAACQRLGYTREEMLRLTTRDIDDPAFAAGFGDRLLQQLSIGQFRCEGRHCTKDGRIIPVDINTSAIVINGQPAVLAVMRDITQRKHAEEALRKQTELLESILVNMADGVIVADERGEFLIVNPEAERLFGPGAAALAASSDPWSAGVSPASLAGETPALRHGLCLPDTVTPFPTAELPLTRAVRGEQIKDVEVFVRHEQAPHGYWVSISGGPLRDGSAVKGVVLVCRDITERKAIERALRESEAFYHSLVESLPQNIFRKDLQGHVTFGNQRYCATLKRSRADLIGKTDFDLFPAALAAKYREDDRKVQESGVPLEVVEEHVLPDGSKIYVQVIKTPIRDGDGKVIGTQGMFWDVTERHRAEEAVAASERRYRQLTEATLDAIVVADEQGRITLFNPAAERTFGYRAAEVVGQSLDLLIPEEYRERHHQGLERYRATHVSRLVGRTVELHGQRKDGTTFPLELALSVIEGDGRSGEPSRTAVPLGSRHLPGGTQFLGAIRDLTERNRIRAVLVQNEKLASIGLLSAGVAHEINNPLAFVANNLAVLDRDNKGLMELLELYRAMAPQLAQVAPEQAARAAELAEEIDVDYIRDNLPRLLGRTRDGVDRVTRIVHSLRGLARTDTPRKQETWLPDLVENSVEIIRGRLRRRGIEVELDYDPASRVRCVSTQISQVLLNLMVNALQAIEAAPHIQPGRICVRTRRLAEEMLIEVSDNGCGIDPEHKARLFDPFFTTKDVGEGTGLGLSISHNIVEGHGGRIEVESEPGAGSCFRIYLPTGERPA